uniref:ORF49f n=2 Tax=Pinus TaxID=3337 RepID=A4QM53_PINKO|nr:ORF49f [Pinus koraiensis]
MTLLIHSVKMHPFPLHPFRWENYWSERRDLRKERGRINNKSIPCMLKNF